MMTIDMASTSFYSFTTSVPTTHAYLPLFPSLKYPHEEHISVISLILDLSVKSHMMF